MRHVAESAHSVHKLVKPTSDPITPMLLAVGCALLIPSIAGVTILVTGASLVSTGTVWRTIQSMSIGIFLAIVGSAGLKYAWRTMQLPGRSPSDYLPLRWWLRRRATKRVGQIVDDLAIVTEQDVDKLKALAKELERRDIYTRAHSGRVSRLTADVLSRMGFSKEECELGRVAALLHDVGKLQIPDSILFKPGPLNGEEERIMQKHPDAGADLASPHAQEEVVIAIRHHHERIDGEGYPSGIRASILPLIARVIPVCDTYDSLISDRPYRAGTSKKDALEQISLVAGRQLDAEVVEVLIEMERERMLLPGMVMFIPVIPFLKKVVHAFHVSTAPTALTAVMLVSTATVGGLAIIEQDRGVPPGRTRPPVAASQPPADISPDQLESVPAVNSATPVVAAARIRAPRPNNGGGPPRDSNDSGETSQTPPPPPHPPCAVAGVTVPELPVLGCAVPHLPGQ